MSGRAAMLVVLVAGAAHAESALEAAAAARVREGLPAGLGLVDLSLPGTAADAATVSVLWRGAPRAGASSILIDAGGKRLWARVRLAPLRPVLVARRALRAGA